VITPEKIEEWIKEIEQRSNSAPLILRYIANRLRDLSERNEELLSENIALRSGERVEEYERRISTLEYQLDLLKRQFGGEFPESQGANSVEDLPSVAATKALSLLVYDAVGHIAHIEINPNNMISGEVIAQLDLGSTPDLDIETLRLLPLLNTEELLFVFTSGRVEALPLTDLPAVDLQTTKAIVLNRPQESLPATIYAGEALACLTPISKMAISEFFVQISRRGYIKKISIAMADSILSNRFIGSGVKQPADQTFELLLCRNDDRLTLTSQEGYILCVDVRDLPSSIEEAIRLSPRDHLVSAFLSPKDSSTLIMTNIAKVIHRTDEFLESAAGYRQRGKAIYSQKRRDEGVRVVGGGAVSESHWGFALHWKGSITVHSLHDLVGSGTIQTGEELLAFCTYPALLTT